VSEPSTDRAHVPSKVKVDAVALPRQITLDIVKFTPEKIFPLHVQGKIEKDKAAVYYLITNDQLLRQMKRAKACDDLTLENQKLRDEIARLKEGDVSR
jgi:hypothetical protein